MHTFNKWLTETVHIMCTLVHNAKWISAYGRIYMRMQVDVCSKQPKKGIHPTHEVENKKIAAEMVDCTSSTCSPSSSTQAEIQTAVQGLRRLLMFDLTGCNVETYCDNAALELRTARILHQFSSRRQVIKMSELGLSKAFASTRFITGGVLSTTLRTMLTVH